MKQQWIVCLLCLCYPVWVQAELKWVKGLATAEKKQTAIYQAYYTILERQLAVLVGDQAYGPAGDRMSREFERDFDNLRTRFFTPDTTHDCIQEDDGLHTCAVEGNMKPGVMRRFVRRFVADTEQTEANQAVFVFSSASLDSAIKREVADHLQQAFVSANHRLLSGGAADRALANDKVDFSLGLYEVDFPTPEFDRYGRVSRGSLRVRFQMRHMKSGRMLAVSPVEIDTQVWATSAQQGESKLRQELLRKVSARVAKSVSQSAIDFLRDQDEDEASVARVASGQHLYLVRLVGVERKDRTLIKRVRKALGSLAPGSQSSTDPARSSSAQVTVALSASQALLHDDVLDALYGEFESHDGFEAEYLDGNEYELHF